MPTQTRVLKVDGEVVIAEKYETLTLVKSELDAEAAELEARRDRLETQADEIPAALEELEAEQEAHDEKCAIYDNAQTEAEANAEANAEAESAPTFTELPAAPPQEFAADIAAPPAGNAPHDEQDEEG
jgi:peptidoglycan hydrolase CwlO-like protein